MTFFLSPQYLATLFILAIIIRALPRDLRPWLVCAGGVGFCLATSFTAFSACIGAVVLTYSAGTIVRRSKNRMMILCCTLIVLSPLIIIKATSFSGSSALSPIPGMSFYLLAGVLHVQNQYRGGAKLSLQDLLISFTFFPSFLAGPIVSPETVKNELQGDAIDNDYLSVHTALLRIAWGFFKKIVIADRIAILLESSLKAPSLVGGSDAFLVGILSYLQVYADYSGYIDIALGSALLFGVPLPENFRLPFLATSLKDFWKRWNITLSGWLRDTIYIPLGGNRNGSIRWCLAVIATFMVSGLWHGNGVRFVLWGLIHGCWIILERAWQGSGIVARAFGWITTVLFLSSTFALFQSPTLSGWLTLMTGVGRSSTQEIFTALLSTLNGWIILCGIFTMLLGEILFARMQKYASGLLWIITVLIVLFTLHAGVFEMKTFIYSNF